jgi:DUF971 family protein
MTPQPTQLTLADENTLVIHWSDGTRVRYDVTQLRRQCPCATCRSEQLEAEKVGEQIPNAQTPVTIRQMIPVGNYAYNIRFSDGHNTGIYSLELLRELGEETGPE